MHLLLGVVGGLSLLGVSVSAHAANLADATYIRQLERISSHTWAVGQACLDPSGKLIEGDVGVTRPIEGFPIDTVSCTAHWRYSDGVMYELGHLLAYSAGEFANWEAYYWGRNSAQEPHPANFSEAWADVVKLRTEAGLKPWSESLTQARCAGEFGFGEAELTLPRLVANPAAKPGELKTVTFVRAIETILSSPATCAEQRSRIQALFAQTTVSDPRDWAWVSWAARHSADFLGHKIIRSHIGTQTQMSRLLPTKDHDAFTSETFLSPTLALTDMMNTAIRFNLAVNGTEKEALEAVAPGKNFGQFSELPKTDQERWLELVAFQPAGLSALFVDPAVRENRLVKFRDACDKRLAQIFGAPLAQVAGSGYELPFHTDPNDTVSRPRWHVFSNLHIYDGSRGEPLYIPAGGSALSGGQDENACFVTYYRKFGNFGASRLVTCHVAEAKVTQEKNADGSVKIGMIGGPGGSGDGGYSHSHLMLYTTDKSARLNFVDAFCR